jgi:hypothetical protein
VVAYELHSSVEDVDGDVPVYLTANWTLADGESIKGFVNVSNGLTVAADASVSIDTFGVPVHGTLSLGNNSALTLPKDLRLAPDSALVIGSDVDEYARLAADAAGSVIYMGGDWAIPSTRTLVISGDVIIDGGNNTLSLGNVSSIFSIRDGSSLTLRNMSITGLVDGASPFVGSGTVIFENCILNVASDATVNLGASNVGHGSIKIDDDVIIRGNGTLSFAGAGLFTINANSSLTVDDGATLAYACYDKVSFVMTDATSVLYMRNSTLEALEALGAGLQLTKGTVIIDNHVVFNNGDNDDEALGIILGDGTEANDVTLKIRAAANLEAAGVFVYNNVDPSAV